MITNTSEAHKISVQWYGEAKALVDSGDLDLAERKRVFKSSQGYDTTLDDDQLMVASMTEEPDDDEFILNVLHIEKHGYCIIPEGDQEAAE